MKKIFFFFFVFAFLFTTPAAFAQTPASPSSLKVAPTATTSSVFANTLTVLFARFEASLSRLEKIAQKINSRIVKLNLIDPQQKTLLERLTKSRTDLLALNAQSKTFISATATRQDYLLFKNQLLTFNKNLKDIYKLELDLVANMKRQAVATATPMITALPTK